MIIRPSFTVLSGAAIGLVAGAAVYGAVSSSATPTSQPTKPVVAAAPAPAAPCAKGQKLEDGVCIIHIVRTVVVPAPAAALVPTTSGAPEASGNQGTASVGHDDATKDASDATKAGGDATEKAKGATAGSATTGSAQDDSADQAGSDHSADHAGSDVSADHAGSDVSADQAGSDVSAAPTP